MAQLAAGAATAATAVAAAKKARPWAKRLADWVSGRRQDNAPSVEESVQEAAQQRLSKDAKIQTGLEGVFLQSLHEIAGDEIDDVRRFKARHLGGGNVKVGGTSSASGGDHRDLIIADRMDFSYPQQRSTSPLLVALLAGAAGVAGAYAWPRITQPMPAAPAAPAAPAPAPVPMPPEPTRPIVIEPPKVSIDDLKLKVKWWVDPQTGEVKTQVIEQK